MVKFLLALAFGALVAYLAFSALEHAKVDLSVISERNTLIEDIK